jgi:hypothetical protein
MGIIDHHCLNFLLFFDVVRIVDHHYLSFLLFFDVGGIIDPVMVNNFTNINKTKESLNSDGQQF